MKKKIIIIIIAGVILVAITGIVLGFTLFNRNKNNVAKYKKEAVKKGDIEAIVVTTGTMNPVTIVDVGSQVSGRINKLYVDFNSVVKQGQLIAEVDQSSFITRVKQSEANYESAKARLEKARVALDNTKKKYDRGSNLFEKNLISYEEMEESETQYFSAKAELQSQDAGLEQAKSSLDSNQIELSYTIIRSPVDGIVITRNVNAGQTVAASFQAPVLFKIANNLINMQVECNVDEADIGKVKEGQKVRFTVDAFPNEEFSGTVTQVRYSPEIVQNVVNYTTIVEVQNPELKLRPGMTATVSIIVGEAKNKLLVPNSALRFMPQLSPEEMRKIYEEMRKGMEERRSATTQADRPTGESRGGNQRPSGERPSGEQFMGRGGQGPEGARMRNFAQVWVENEKGELRPVWIRTGVTDNSFTEVVSGTLQEGQEVITGQSSGQGRDSGTRSMMQRGVMFMRG